MSTQLTVQLLFFAVAQVMEVSGLPLQIADFHPCSPEASGIVFP